MTAGLARAIDTVRRADFAPLWGTVRHVAGMALDIEGLGRAATVGARILIQPDGDVERGGEALVAEVISADRGIARAMPFRGVSGVAPGTRVQLSSCGSRIAPSAAWLGRIVDGLGRSADGAPEPRPGNRARLLKAGPPPAGARARLGPRLETGVGAIDLFTPVAEGQRLGLFAGSGVGKSVLAGMLARFAECDVAVIALIGERGREVREFIEDELGKAGLSKAVIVAATSDESALMRRQAAYTAMSVAEHFRDEGKRVFLLMDSVTRFAHACREIGLAAGEPPTTRGYTPSVFSELPRLAERAGPGAVGAGTITAIFSVLVEGGDLDEPVADAMRGILDGHIVLDREIARRGRFPAIDLTASLSRAETRLRDQDEAALVAAARERLSTFGDMEELVRLGAYKDGSNGEVDAAVASAPLIERLCAQQRTARADAGQLIAELREILA